jgi:hypothetical protein
MTRCEAIKKNGQRCEREALPGKKFCWQHEGGKKSPIKKSKAFDTLYFYEGQSALKCGQHALNNLLGNIRKGRLSFPLFISEAKGALLENHGDYDTFNLQTFCKERAEGLKHEMEYEDEFSEADFAKIKQDAIACFARGDYDIYLLCDAVKKALKARVTVSDVIYRGSKKDVEGVKISDREYLESLMDSKSGLIVNLKASHYICVVYMHGGWTAIDSIGKSVIELKNSKEVLDFIEKKKFAAAFAVRVRKILE